MFSSNTVGANTPFSAKCLSLSLQWQMRLIDQANLESVSMHYLTIQKKNLKVNQFLVLNKNWDSRVVQTRNPLKVKPLVFCTLYIELNIESYLAC